MHENARVNPGARSFPAKNGERIRRGLRESRYFLEVSASLEEARAGDEKEPVRTGSK